MLEICQVFGEGWISAKFLSLRHVGHTCQTSTIFGRFIFFKITDFCFNYLKIILNIPIR